VANLQVKNLPDDLHEKLRARARAQRTTVSELVTQMLRRELSRPSMEEWLAEVRKLPRHEGIDVVGALDEAREDYARR